MTPLNYYNKIKKNDSCYEYIPFDDTNFPIRVVWNKMMTDEECNNLCILRWHEQFEIKYFIKGTAEIICDSSIFTAEAGDIVIINPCEQHSIRALSGIPEYHLLMIEPNILRSRETNSLDLEYIIPFVEGRIKFKNLIRNDELIGRTILQMLSELSEHGAAYEFMLKGLIFTLFAQLFRYQIRNIRSEEDMSLLRSFIERLDPAVSYIHGHYNEAISLDKLAKLCNMTMYYFCRTFKSVTSVTTTQYINQCRMDKAEILLRTTNLQLNEIAEKVGINDSCYFSRMYKQIKGMPPSNVRKQQNS